MSAERSCQSLCGVWAAALLSPTCAPTHRGSLSGKPDDWPQDMKEYVERCFTACESEEDKDRTEKLLKEVLQARLQDGSAYTIDWSREPLPGSVLGGRALCAGRVPGCQSSDQRTLGARRAAEKGTGKGALGREASGVLTGQECWGGVN